MNLTRLALMLFALVQLAGAGVTNWMAVHDSLADIEPWMRRSWLADRGLQEYYKAMSWRPESTGLRCVGRWSYGPSVKVSLRATAEDTIVCLARGSGASIIRFRSQDSLTLDLLSDINCSGIVSRAIIQDTLVFCGMQQGGTGIEVWGVSDLSTPHRLSYVYLPSVMDIAVRDTFLYSIGYQQDSLRVFNVADPANPVQVGACADSAINGMCVAGNYCYLADQYGLYVVDVGNPTNPHRVAAVGGFEALAVTVRDTLCYVGTYTTEFALRVYNVKEPTMPFPVGSLPGIEAHDIYLPPTCDTALYTPKLHVINITNPASPRQIGFVDCPGWDYGVAAVPALNYALVADYFKGVVAVNISGPTAPELDTLAFAGDDARDITIDNGKAYLASYHSGLQILDVSDPTRPSYLGCYDTAGTAGVVRSATARDSFAFVSWPAPRMLSIDVTDPCHPSRAAGCSGMFNPPEDMLIRDSFVYCAEMRRLQVVNVARPREPVLVGSCVLPDESGGMSLQESLAFVPNAPTQVVNVADPAHPVVVAQIDRYAWNVFVKDTLAFFAGGNGLFIYSVANINSPYLIDSTAWNASVFDVVVVDTLAYVGCRDGVRLLSVTDPADPQLLAFSSTPYDAWRLTCAGPYVYVACSEAGICVFETTQTAVAEPRGLQPRLTGGTTVTPCPAGADAVLHFARHAGCGLSIMLRDAAGRRVDLPMTRTRLDGEVKLDLSLMGSGVYFVEVREGNRSTSVKLVKR